MSEDQDRIPSDDYERELSTDLDDKTRDKPKGLALHTKILIGLLVGVVVGLAVNQIVRYYPEPSSPFALFFNSIARILSLGWYAPEWTAAEIVDGTIRHFTAPVGTFFLFMLLMIVVPLVFSSLVVGVAGIGDIRKLGR